MKISFINYYYDKDTSIGEYINKYQTIHGWCKALNDLGLKVSVYHRFSQDNFFLQDNVEYFLIKDNKKNSLKWYQTPIEFHKKVCQEKHEILHVNSFIYSYQAYLLKRQIPSAKIVMQHHAEHPQKRIKRFLIKYFSSSIDGFIFTSREIYNEWLKIKIVSSGKKFSEIMEGSSNFSFANRKEMRIKTNLSGNPVILWVGRLNDNKDPLTILSGFLKLHNNYPQAKLYMIYSEEKLEKRVLSFISQYETLLSNVKLLGMINHNEICDYYNSADYFVLGSHYEGSGYSLVEALSCGVVPIVTDIPSFRMMTNKGETGGLWKPGDSDSFYTIAKEVLSKPLETEVKKTIDIYSENLSYSAIAKKAKKFYESLTGN